MTWFEDKRPAVPMRKVCANCKNDYNDGDKYCRYCGAPMGKPEFIEEEFVPVWISRTGKSWCRGTSEKTILGMCGRTDFSLLGGTGRAAALNAQTVRNVLSAEGIQLIHGISTTMSRCFA